MKNTILSVIVVLLVSGCSHKTENTVTTTASVPQFPIVPGDVVNTSVDDVTGRVPWHPRQRMAVVNLEFSAAEAAKFRQFTKDHLHQKVQIMVGTNVVGEPVIEAEIPGPQMELAF